MGRPATITSAQIMLGAITGADFQLRTGGEPVLADLQPAARATDAGGLVTMRPACGVPKRGIGMLTCQYDCGSGPRAGSIAGL